MNLQKLTELWVSLTLKLFKKVIVNERYLIIGDGIKIAKSGKKMPAVKGLHQVSSSNTKPEFIMGHSCQAIALLAQGRGNHFAVPLASRIHEGLMHSDIPKQTLSEKMIALLKSLKLDRSFYLVLDAFYSNRKIIKGTRNARTLGSANKKQCCCLLSGTSSRKTFKRKTQDLWRKNETWDYISET
jgi:hypothetical protein